MNAKQAVIQNDDGDVKIVRGRFKNLELKDDLGDLKIKDVIFANSQIEMADGDIQAENVTFTGKNEIRSSLGDITLSIPEKTLADLSVEAEASEINIPEELGKVMTDEDDEQSVDSGIRHRIPSKLRVRWGYNDQSCEIIMYKLLLKKENL